VSYADGHTELGAFYDQNRKSVPLAEIPKHVQDAVIAAEDRSFWTNPGISLPGMARAAAAIARGEQLQGGSTITQQYVKVMYLSQERTMGRKLDELFIATKISRTRDKRSILQDYLNTIYFGEGAYGIRAAGQVYFGVDHPKDLSVAQAAYLATVLNNPTKFDPDDPASVRVIRGRYQYVLKGMAAMSAITPTQFAASFHHVPLVKRKTRSNRYAGPTGFLLDLARRELAKYGFEGDQLSGGGLHVITTFDYALQQKAVAAVNRPGPASLHVGLASVRPGTGELVAMVGGPNFLKSQRNWATTKAPPGTLLRPFVLAAGLADHGRPFALSESSAGLDRAYFDLVDSGRGPLIAKAAEAAGIPPIPAVDRGSPGLGPDALASPVDLAAAYSTFAADGLRVPTHVIKEVRDSRGKLLWSAGKDPGLRPTRAFGSEVSKAATGILAQANPAGVPAKSSTVLGSSIENRRRTAKCHCRRYKKTQPLATWQVGYTSELSTALVYRAGTEGESALPGTAFPAVTLASVSKSLAQPAIVR
jgi:membrane peptidoglycan carboxypeptidase